jgi:hypothetical protein
VDRPAAAGGPAWLRALRPGGLGWALLGAGLFCALSPPRLQGGDLSVQLGLVLAAQGALPGDLLTRAAPGRPGFAGLLHAGALALPPEALSLALLLLQIVALVVIFIGLGRLLPLGRRAGLLLLLLLAWPQPIGAAALLIEPQPIHRMLAAGPLLLGLGAALAGRAGRAGLLLGLGLALHPSTGWVAALAGVAAAGPRTLPGLGLGAAALLSQRSGAPIWGPLHPEEWSALQLRLGHHLDASTWPAGPRALLLLRLVLLGLLGAGAGPRWRRAAAAVGAAAALGLAAPAAQIGALLQLHGLYAELWALALSLPLIASRLAAQGPPRIFAGMALLALIPWGLAARPWPTAERLQAERGAAALRPTDDPWPRITERRAAAFTVKDGGEILSNPDTLRAWVEGLRQACGEHALRPPAPTEDWRGYVRVRRRCRDLGPLDPTTAQPTSLSTP